MDIFDLFTLCGGIAFFLYGMSLLSSSLEKVAGGKMEQMLKKMTSNPIKSLLLGAGITIAIQSSTAVTVMLVGLVNSGIMELGQSIGVIMGSNVGTTLTAWILSLSGLEGDVIWIQLLKPENFSPVVALLGIILRRFGKHSRTRSAGTIMIGFSILMYGTIMMKDAASPLAAMPEFQAILTLFSNPLLGVLAGAVLTIIVNSSAASVAILQSLALAGGITYGMAIPIIMGQNIGTCLTALLSSLGGNRSAKRVAVVHISFNVIGTIVGLVGFYGTDLLFQYAFMDRPIDALGIAVCHSVFNVATTGLLLPFIRQLEKLAYLIIREDKVTGPAYTFVDPLLLKTPSVAIAECASKTNEMASLAERTFQEALALIGRYDEKTADTIREDEEKLDQYEDKLGTILVQLSSKSLSGVDSRSISKQLHSIGDFERIGDHALNLVGTAQEIHDKDIHFSDASQEEMETLSAALREILRITTEAFTTNNIALASQVEPLEQVIDCMIADIKSNHISRLQKGHCTIEMGFVLSDMLTNCERVSDHCSNIAVAQIETAQNEFRAHEYLNGVKTAASPEFQGVFDRYRAKFALKIEPAPEA